MGMKTAKVTLGSLNYKTTILVAGHKVIADEPEDLGGGDAGSTATHLLLSSLGACTAVTLRMYAERKEWDLGDIAINLTINQENRNGKMFSDISREISFGEELSEDQLERMMIIADKCPIHKTLMGEINIRTF